MVGKGGRSGESGKIWGGEGERVKSKLKRAREDGRAEKGIEEGQQSKEVIRAEGKEKQSMQPGARPRGAVGVQELG